MQWLSLQLWCMYSLLLVAERLACLWPADQLLLPVHSETLHSSRSGVMTFVVLHVARMLLPIHSETLHSSRSGGMRRDRWHGICDAACCPDLPQWTIPQQLIIFADSSNSTGMTAARYSCRFPENVNVLQFYRVTTNQTIYIIRHIYIWILSDCLCRRTDTIYNKI